MFETFCRDLGLSFDRIEEGNERTPDYRLTIDSLVVIAEVKQIDPNKEELKLLRRYQKEGRADGGGTIGERMRKVIGSGSAQIRLAAKGRHPSILVVWNNVEIDGVQPLLDHTDANQVKAAMYGFEEVHLIRDRDSREIISSTPAGQGGGRKMNETDNNSISAVGVLTRDLARVIHLIIYHNVYADFPLPLFRSERVHHYTLSEPAPDEFQDWKRI
jgi:hypothetical protein